jgi:hypothetical protein
MTKLPLVSGLLLALLVLTVPSLALAADGTVSLDTIQLAGIVAQVVAVSGIIMRLVKITTPLHAQIPVRFRWVPEALIGTAGVLALQMAGVTSVGSLVEVSVQALVVFLGFAVTGYHSPDPGTTPPPTTIS